MNKSIHKQDKINQKLKEYEVKGARKENWRLFGKGKGAVVFSGPGKSGR